MRSRIVSFGGLLRVEGGWGVTYLDIHGLTGGDDPGLGVADYLDIFGGRHDDRLALSVCTEK